jgi:Fe-S cluster assembly iron-binding protein IscA
MALDEPRDNDEVFDDKGLKYVIEKELLEKVQPIRVDFVNSPMGSGFNISSNMPVGASCGSSCSC